MVPYGSTMVNEGNVTKCSEGYDTSTGDCPDDLPEPVDAYSMRAGYQRAVDAGVD